MHHGYRPACLEWKGGCDSLDLEYDSFLIYSCRFVRIPARPVFSMDILCLCHFSRHVLGRSLCPSTGVDTRTSLAFSTPDQQGRGCPWLESACLYWIARNHGWFKHIPLFRNGTDSKQVQSYYRREMYTVCYLLAIIWPASYGLDFVRKNWVISATWALACASMSVFTMLPAIKVEDTRLMYVGPHSSFQTRLTTLDSRVASSCSSLAYCTLHSARATWRKMVQAKMDLHQQRQNVSRGS